VGKVNRPYIPRTRKHLSCGMPLKIFYKKEGWRSSSKHYAYGLCPIAEIKNEDARLRSHIAIEETKREVDG